MGKVTRRWIAFKTKMKEIRAQVVKTLPTIIEETPSELTRVEHQPSVEQLSPPEPPDSPDSFIMKFFIEIVLLISPSS